MARVDKKLAIAVFFMIAVLIRYYFSFYKPNFLSAISGGMFYAVLTGIGPFVGALMAICLLRRRMRYSIFGVSVTKSLIAMICPVFLFGLFDTVSGDWQFTYTKIVIICLLYAYFEEYGWRVYLQSELINLHKWCRISIITVMWFAWHLNFELSVANLIFFAILFLGSWGIGQIAIRSESVIACACFHSVVNVVQNVDITIVSLGLILLCVIFWFWLWYGKWCIVFK